MKRCENNGEGFFFRLIVSKVASIFITESTGPILITGTVGQASLRNTRAKCALVIMKKKKKEEGCERREKKCLPAKRVARGGTAISPHDQMGRCPSQTHLQPASDSFSAYIRPMSPMPISPTVKFSIPAGTWLVCAEAIAPLLCCPKW